MTLIKRFLPFVILIFLISIGLGTYLAVKNKAKQPKKETVTPPQTAPKEEETKTEEEPEENLTNINPETVTEEAKENFNKAESLALKWKDDAFLVYVNYKLNSLKLNEGQETYVFDSEKALNLHFTVTFSQKSKKYIRAAIPKEDYLGELLPIDQKYWKINYLAAFQIAEKNGGKDFREKYPKWEINLNLKRDEPKNWLYFIVEYKTKEGDSVSFKINPMTSELVEKT